MTELAIRDEHAEIQTVGPEANFPTAQGAMRLVEWAQEAQAANHLAKALVRTPFAGSWRGDEDGATAAILKGAEVGLTPVTALGAFDNIQGTPAPKAITLRALVQSHGHDLEIIEETDERAVARYRRNGKGEWQTTEFTIDHARAMNLLGKDNWKKQPGNMLIARVTSKAARLVASDVILGIGYSAEEIRDSDDWQQRTLPSLPAANEGTAADRMGAALGGGDVQSPQGSPVEDARTSAQPDAISQDTPESPLLNTSGKLAKHMFALLGELGITDRESRLLYVSDVVGREVTSSADMTDADAEQVIAALQADLEQPFPTEPPA